MTDSTTTTEESRQGPKPKISGETRPVDLQELKKQIRKLYSRHNKDEALVKYKIGTLVDTAMGDPARYGEHAVEKIAKSIGVSPVTLYRWAGVAVGYSEEEFRELAGKRTQRNTFVSFTHLQIVSMLNDLSLRKQLIAEVVAKGLSTDDVYQRVLELKKWPAQKPKAKGPTVPRSISGGLKAMRCAGDKFLDYCKVFDQGVIDRIRETPDKELDVGLLEELTDTEEVLAAVIQKAQAQLAEVKQCANHLEKVDNQRRSKHLERTGTTKSARRLIEKRERVDRVKAKRQELAEQQERETETAACA